MCFQIRSWQLYYFCTQASNFLHKRLPNRGVLYTCARVVLSRPASPKRVLFFLCQSTWVAPMTILWHPRGIWLVSERRNLSILQTAAVLGQLDPCLVGCFHSQPQGQVRKCFLLPFSDQQVYSNMSRSVALTLYHPPLPPTRASFSSPLQRSEDAPLQGDAK